MSTLYNYQETTIPYTVGFHPVFTLATLDDDPPKEDIRALLENLNDHLNNIIYSMNQALDVELPYSAIEILSPVLFADSEDYILQLDETDMYEITFTRKFCTIFLDLKSKDTGKIQRFSYIFDLEADLEDEADV